MTRQAVLMCNRKICRHAGVNISLVFDADFSEHFMNVWHMSNTSVNICLQPVALLLESRNLSTWCEYVVVLNATLVNTL